MEHLYAPWRYSYVSDEKDKRLCILSYTKNKDDKNIKFYLVMNIVLCCYDKYPYSPGHFMVVPNFHTSNIEDLDDEIWQRVQKVKQTVKLLKKMLCLVKVLILV